MFQRKTVDGVVSQFKKLIDQLNAVKDQWNKKVDDKNDWYWMIVGGILFGILFTVALPA